MNDSKDILVDKYIAENNRNELWNLIIEYGNDINLDKIIDYYILKKYHFDICDMLTYISESLDLDKVFDKIVATKDKEFLLSILKNGSVQSVIEDKYLAKLKKACE